MLKFLVLLAIACAGATSVDAESVSREIVIKDHHFLPAEIIVPAGQRVKLVIDNQDPAPEEFESKPFKREKIVAGGSRAVVWVGPLQPGVYQFFGEFNPQTAQGRLVVR